MFDLSKTLSHFRKFIPKALTGPEPRPRISALLIDISGNLHVGKTPTPDAVKAFQRLKESGIPFRLCSNSSKESTASLVQRLDDMGFEISEAEKALTQVPGHAAKRLVWTSIGAVAQIVQNMNLHRPYLLLSPSAADEVKPPEHDIRASSTEIVEYDSVVVGLHPASFNYDQLNTAFRILKGEMGTGQAHGKSAPLIATHKAKYIQTESGLSLGPGPFVTALENASGVDAIVVGKPTKSFFEMAINDFGDEISASSDGRIVVIGDDVEADLGGGALDLNLWRVLVKTGKYRPGDEHRPGITAPDEVFDSFAAFVNNLLENNPSGL